MDPNRPMTKRERKEARRLEKLAAGSSAKSDTMKWIIIGVGSVIFIALFAFVIFLIKQGKNKPVVLSQEGHVRGVASAKLALTEFGDFQCPACKSYEPFVRQVSKDFEGRVKVVFKHFPLTSIHPNAMLASQVSEAAGNQGKFWEMHDWLYDNQDSWAGLSGAAAKEKMLSYAKSLKLDMKKLEKDINSSDTSKKISANQNEGINSGVSSTPTFFINNKKIQNNPQNYEDLKKIIEEALK